MAIVTIAMYAMKKVFGAVALNVLEEAMQPGKSGTRIECFQSKIASKYGLSISKLTWISKNCTID